MWTHLALDVSVFRRDGMMVDRHMTHIKNATVDSQLNALASLSYSALLIQ